MLKENSTNLNITSDHPGLQAVPGDVDVTHTADKFTLYIGDSMIKHIKSSKMSSSSQKAAVFSYPGATAGGIHTKLRTDSEFQNLDHSKVDKVFVVCGANNVDRVLNIPLRLKSSFVNHPMYQLSEHNLRLVKTEFDQLSSYISNLFPSAKLNFVNILPRVSSIRNHVINLLNEHINSMTASFPNLSMVSTELNRNLFVSIDGHRKDIYFSAIGEDNVHFNDDGNIRLARHLKYLPHNG